MFRQLVKTIARIIPAIDPLVRQRDTLLSEVEQLQHNRSVRSRREPITEHLNLNCLGSEIGPSYNLLMRKSQGYHIEIADHAGAKHLREQYRSIGQDVSHIQDVDYVAGNGSIFEAIGKPGRYHYIVASHVIDHVPDLLEFLKDCERLQKPEQTYSEHAALTFSDAPVPVQVSIAKRSLQIATRRWWPSPNYHRFVLALRPQQHRPQERVIPRLAHTWE